jgi:hypothetical protein
MIIRYFFAFVALILITITSVAAQSLALTGSIRSGNGPVSGASVYVTQTADANGNSVGGHVVGPVASGGNGQFSFYNLPSGQYSVRVTVAGVAVWQGSARVPGQLSPIVLH